ncbi:hypothetical protein [Sphingorhabdus sp.]|uniref:hypothetical protein n=1 Tax=Sphingorhabdus sp. TaxID=1902408 RepID=UPI0033407940
MSKLIVLIAVLMFSQTLLAATPEERAAAEVECKQVIEQNFQAINEENLKALLATCSVYSGTAEQGREFVAQTKEMFEETNVYMTLTDFEIIKVVTPRAYAWVTQRTIAQRPEDHKPKNPGLNYRHHSALLPEYEEVRYKQRFNFEGGEWKVHKVVSAPEPVNGSKRLVVESAPSKCPNGKCSMPFVKVR